MKAGSSPQRPVVEALRIVAGRATRALAVNEIRASPSHRHFRLKRLKPKSLHAASPSTRRAATSCCANHRRDRLMEASRDLAVRDGGPQLTDDDAIAAMQARGRRPVDDAVAYPFGDARAWS